VATGPSMVLDPRDSRFDHLPLPGRRRELLRSGSFRRDRASAIAEFIGFRPFEFWSGERVLQARWWSGPTRQMLSQDLLVGVPGLTDQNLLDIAHDGGCPGAGQSSAIRPGGGDRHPVGEFHSTPAWGKLLWISIDTISRMKLQTWCAARPEDQFLSV